MDSNEKIEKIDVKGMTEGLNNEAPQETVPTEVPPTLSQEPQPQPIGSLFGNITYYNLEDVPNFFNRMTTNDAVFILLSAARYCQAKGLYSLEESEAISRAIRIVTTPPQQSSENKPE